MKKIILIALCLCSMTVFAAPREIIIIRHADKWTGYSGQFLSPKGQMRAEKFVSYYLKKFPQPDFIFASKPGDSKHPNESDSFRPVQTVAPLANELSFLNKKSFIVHLPYFQKQYLALSKELLNGSVYKNKLILICWQHGKINFLTRDLGVKKHLSFWKKNNYDQVYILKYDLNGKLSSFQVLKNQYPVSGNLSWGL